MEKHKTTRNNAERDKNDFKKTQKRTLRKDTRSMKAFK